MTKTMISIKVDPKIKKVAQQTAENLGLSLSAVINAQLCEFVRNRELHVGGELHPTPYLQRILEQAEKDRERGEQLSPVFDNARDAIAYLKKQMKK